MDEEQLRSLLNILIKKAAEADKADDAMKFSQAACNAANALIGLINLKREGK